MNKIIIRHIYPAVGSGGCYGTDCYCDQYGDRRHGTGDWCHSNGARHFGRYHDHLDGKFTLTGVSNEPRPC